MPKYMKAQICNVTYTPTGNPAYYEPTDEGRLEFAKYLDEIKAHVGEGQALVITEVEMSEEEYQAFDTFYGWWQIWE